MVVPAREEYNAEFRLEHGEATELAAAIQRALGLSQAPIVVRLRYAEAGASFLSHVVAETSEGEQYGIRPLANMQTALAATRVLEACQTPNVSPMRTMAAIPWLPRHNTDLVVFRRLSGLPRNLGNHTVRMDMESHRVAALRDAGGWACVGPVIGVGDAHYGNFVWDLQDKRYARVDLQDAFRGDFSVQSTLMPIIAWRLLTRPQWSAPASADVGVEAFQEAFSTMHHRLRMTYPAWSADVQAAAGQGVLDRVRRWIELPLEEKLRHVGASLLP